MTTAFFSHKDRKIHIFPTEEEEILNHIPLSTYALQVSHEWCIAEGVVPPWS